MYLVQCNIVLIGTKNKTGKALKKVSSWNRDGRKCKVLS